jgi:FlaA1/EpsC-like NDP-sugar epimerase
MIKKFRHDYLIIISTIWRNLLLFTVFLLIGAFFLKHFGADPQASWGQHILDAFNMASMERVETGGKTIPVLLAFILPIGMAVILGEGILRVFAIYANRHVDRKEWNVMVAKTIKEQTIICGAGEMGQQLLRQMLRTDPSMDVILIDPRPGLLTELGLSEEHALHFQSDMSDVDTLEQANIRHAKLAVLSAGDDALNLETAYKILQLNPNLPIWVRLHHSALAELMDLSRKPNIHFFSPYEQAAKVIVTYMMEK